jgi:hypothetical protein
MALEVHATLSHNVAEEGEIEAYDVTNELWVLQEAGDGVVG